MKKKASLVSQFIAAAYVAASWRGVKQQMVKGFGKISETQKIALDAGTAKHEKEFYTGKPDWEKLDDLPLPHLSETAMKMLGDKTRELGKLLDDWQIRNSEEQDISPQAWEYLKKNKFLGLVIPEERGGLGLGAYEHAQIVSKIATHSISGALTAMVPNSLGPGELIEKYGTEGQKEHYLPRLADGRFVPFFGLTEPEAGSDAFSGKTTGVVYSDEETGEAKIRINGEKRYITLSGQVGTLGGLSINLEDPGNILGKGVKPGITCVLIEPGTPGFDIGKRHRPLDVPFQNGPLFMKDAVISANDIIGGPEMAGKGALMLMECLGIGRSISLPATSGAAGRKVAYTAGAYAAIREQFGFPLSQMEGLHESLATIAANTYMIEAARTAMALRIDNGETPSIGSAILKAHATEAMAEIVEAGMRLQGGKAIQGGPRNVMGQLASASYIARTVEGDNHMTQSMLIFGQGSKKSHEFMSDEINAAQKGDDTAFKTLLKAHVADTIDNMGRAFAMGLTGKGGKAPDYATPETADMFSRINRVSAAFNVAANVALGTLAEKLQTKQRTSKRLGEVHSNMMLSYYTLWHFHKVHNGNPAFLPLVQYTVDKRMKKAEEALSDLIDNFPMKDGMMLKALKAVLRASIFPRGEQYKNPSDALETAAAETITNPGTVRSWLASGMLIPEDESNPVRHIGKAFDFIMKETAPLLRELEKRIDHDLGRHNPDFAREIKKQMRQDMPGFVKTAENLDLIDPHEIDILEQAMKYRREVVDVDYFAPENLKKGISANPLGKPPSFS